jgi:hypothetical protein
MFFSSEISQSSEIEIFWCMLMKNRLDCDANAPDLMNEKWVIPCENDGS